jgi:hypothetical protein
MQVSNSKITSFLMAVSFLFFYNATAQPGNHAIGNVNQPKIQVALLLDVSNSMDGLIAQAKSQLWNMVNVLGQVKCGGKTPAIEIALYEYGRPANGPSNNYIKQINGFITDLDSLSGNLFNISTSGGDEYCGAVLQKSLQELPWNNNPKSYKAIFIAGNEDFLQGNIKYTLACNLAKDKNIIVNTIYCGDKAQGIREHWNLANECNGGSFTNINTNQELYDVKTPYDSVLITYNLQLNTTYYAYGGEVAYYKKQKQTSTDRDNMAFNQQATMQRIAAKSNAAIYDNSGWDIVDAFNKNADFFSTLDPKLLPDSLKQKTIPELKLFATEKANQRASIQKQIGIISTQRANYLMQQTNQGQQDLTTQMEGILKQQIMQVGMQF